MRDTTWLLTVIFPPCRVLQHHMLSVCWDVWWRAWLGQLSCKVQKEFEFVLCRVVSALQQLKHNIYVYSEPGSTPSFPKYECPYCCCFVSCYAEPTFLGLVSVSGVVVWTVTPYAKVVKWHWLCYAKLCVLHDRYYVFSVEASHKVHWQHEKAQIQIPFVLYMIDGPTKPVTNHKNR